MLRLSLLFLAATALSAAGLTRERLIALVKSATPDAEIRKAVLAEGLDFEPNAAILSEIREAGGSLGLTAFLSSYQRTAPPAPSVKPHSKPIEKPKEKPKEKSQEMQEIKPAGKAPIAIPQPAPLDSSSRRRFRPFLNLSYTSGGDILDRVPFTDGTSSAIRAGGETLFKGGLDLHLTQPFSFQVSFGFHATSTQKARNGGKDFKRSAMEALAFWHPGDHWRLGLGIRKATDAKVTGSGDAWMNTKRYDSSLGGIVEIEFLTGLLTSFGSRGGASLRYVNEKYTPASVDGIGPVTGPAVDGSHFGIGLSWYF